MARSDASEPTRRFDRRVDDYVRYRPGYPAEMLDALRREIGLTPQHVVADIGSGTGILARLFLDNGNRVYGVEPNGPMRAAAEAVLANYDAFRSVDARAELTGLPDAVADVVAAGQAFHWFDIEPTRREFARILKPSGWCVLIWNSRRTQSTPFLIAFEAFLRTWGTDYAEVSSRYEDPAALAAFFRDGAYEKRSFDNEQTFDRDGLRGRVTSSSYIPAPDEAGFDDMVLALDRLFEEHEQGGCVCFEYDTNLYVGKV